MCHNNQNQAAILNYLKTKMNLTNGNSNAAIVKNHLNANYINNNNNKNLFNSNFSGNMSGNQTTPANNYNNTLPNCLNLNEISNANNLNSLYYCNIATPPVVNNRQSFINKTSDAHTNLANISYHNMDNSNSTNKVIKIDSDMKHTSINPYNSNNIINSSCSSTYPPMNLNFEESCSNIKLNNPFNISFDDKNPSEDDCFDMFNPSQLNKDLIIKNEKEQEDDSFNINFDLSEYFKGDWY